MNKKGQGLRGLYTAILTLLLIGIVLGIGIYVLSSTSDAISTETITTYNETITGLSNTTGDYISVYDDCGAHNFQILDVTNETDGTILSSGNYTFDTLGLLKGTTGIYIGQDVNVSYYYTGTSDTSTDGACGVMSTTSTGVGTMADWIAVIVVVIAAAIILGIVISSFGKGRGV